jgi:hypothetical protein
MPFRRTMSPMRYAALPVITVMFLFSFCTSITAQLKPSQFGRGDEWLSWRPEQRQGYVFGYIDGYLGGTSSSCNLADELFETGKPHTLGDGHRPSDQPSARCLARRGEFSKFFSDRNVLKDGHLDVSMYTDVITEFYEKHGNCREYPFSMLMENLSSKYSTADELYGAASRGELKGRSREWCGLGATPAR